MKVLHVPADGPLLASERDVTDLIGDAWSVEAKVVAIPLSRLGNDFLRLETRIAGEVVQKFVNYGLRLVIVGDVSEATAASKSLRDFVYESNRRPHLWFVADAAELEARLAAG